MLKPITLTLFISILMGACSAPETSRKEGESKTIELELTQGTNIAAALSPDQNTIAIDLQGRIWTMPAEGGEATAITDATDDSHEPAWAPDGERVAFHSYREGTFDIWVVDRDGSNLQQITQGPHDDREPTWMPDGEKIVFSSDRAGNYDIWEIDLSSGDLQQVTTHEAEDYNPAVSTDGTRIAFASERQEPGIYIKAGEKVFLTGPTEQRLAAPSWQPNGENLIFMGYKGETTHLYRTPVQGQKIHEITPENADIFPVRASWKNDSTFIYTADGKIRQRVLGHQGFEEIPFQAHLPVTKPAYQRKQYDFDLAQKQKVKGITGPDVSPDGAKVAFSALGDIYVKEIGGEITQITDDTHVDIDPDWSPDGSKLAFASDRDGRMEIWILDMQSRETHLLTDQGKTGAKTPSWSPGGRKIAFHTMGHRNVWGSSALQVAKVATGEVTQVHDPVFAPGKPSWSPDGRFITMMALDRKADRFREGINKFLIIPADSGTARFVSPDPPASPGMRIKNGPIWSPEGDKMAYIQEGVLWSVPVDERGIVTGAPQQITDETASKISWSGDGASIVYMGTDQLKQVHVETGQTDTIPINLSWQREKPDNEYIIHAGKVFNGIDSTYLENKDIVVRENRIQTIRPHQNHEEGVRVIDASDQVVMPGLFESHAHLHHAAGEKTGKLFLSYGITSVRETGADPYDARGRKESWASGQRPGPRAFYTGGLMDGSRVYYGLANSIINEEHLNRELKRARRLDYDLLKTYVRMPATRQKQVIEAAHDMGIPVSSHEIYPAAKFGVDAVEHLRGTSKEGYSNKLSYKYNMYEDAIQIIAQSEMYVTPTIVMHGGYMRMALQNPSLLDHPQLNTCYHDDYIQGYREHLADFRKSGDDPGRNFENLAQNVVEIIQAGGNVTAGTDVPFLPFGSSLHAELWLYVEAGLTPFQALQTATINAARSAGVADDLGSIESGKLADLVIIDGDPLNNIRATLHVDRVIKNGVGFKLEEVLEGCE